MNRIDNGDFEAAKQLFEIFYEGKNVTVRCAFEFEVREFRRTWGYEDTDAWS